MQINRLGHMNPKDFWQKQIAEISGSIDSLFKSLDVKSVSLSYKQSVWDALKQIISYMVKTDLYDSAHGESLDDVFQSSFLYSSDFDVAGNLKAADVRSVFHFRVLSCLQSTQSVDVLSGLESLTSSLSLGHPDRLYADLINFADVMRRKFVSLGMLEIASRYEEDFFIRQLSMLPAEIIGDKYLVTCDLNQKNYVQSVEVLRQLIDPVEAFNMLYKKMKHPGDHHNYSQIENATLDLLLEVSDGRQCLGLSAGMQRLVRHIYGLRILSSDPLSYHLDDLEEDLGLNNLVKFLQSGFEVSFYNFLLESSYDVEYHELVQNFAGLGSQHNPGLDLADQFAYLSRFLTESFEYIHDFLDSRIFKHYFFHNTLELVGLLGDVLTKRYQEKSFFTKLDGVMQIVESSVSRKNYYIINTLLVNFLRLSEDDDCAVKRDFMRLVCARYKHSKSNSKSLRRIIVLLARAESSHGLQEGLKFYLSGLTTNEFDIHACLFYLENLVVRNCLTEVAQMEGSVVDNMIPCMGDRLGAKGSLYIHNLVTAASRFSLTRYRPELIQKIVRQALTEVPLEAKHPLFSELVGYSVTHGDKALNVDVSAYSLIKASCEPTPTCLSVHGGTYLHCINSQIIEPDIGVVSMFEKKVLRAYAEIQFVIYDNRDAILISPVYGGRNVMSDFPLFLDYFAGLSSEFNLPVLMGVVDHSMQADYLQTGGGFGFDYKAFAKVILRNHHTSYQWFDLPPHAQVYVFERNSLDYAVATLEVNAYCFDPQKKA